MNPIDIHCRAPQLLASAVLSTPLGIARHRGKREVRFTQLFAGVASMTTSILDGQQMACLNAEQQPLRIGHPHSAAATGPEETLGA